MTGYESKRAAAQSKLVVTDIDGHVVRDARKPKNAQPAPVQEFGLTRERFNALEDEITTLQAEWQSALKEVERLKAAQLAQEHELTLQEQLVKARADWDKAQVDWRKADTDMDKAYAYRRKAKAALERIEKLMEQQND